MSPARSSFLCTPAADSSPARRCVIDGRPNTSIASLAARASRRGWRPRRDRTRLRHRSGTRRNLEQSSWKVPRSCGSSAHLEDAALAASTSTARSSHEVARYGCDRCRLSAWRHRLRHAHPGPGIRRLLFGGLTIDRRKAPGPYGPGAAWLRAQAFRCALLRPGASTPHLSGSCCCRGSERRSARFRHLDLADDDQAETQRAESSRGAASTLLRNGGRNLVEQLEPERVDLASACPARASLPVLDAALRLSSIRLVSCRHEPGASNAAEAYGS